MGFWTPKPQPEPELGPRLVALFGYQGLLMEAAMEWRAFEYAARGLVAPNYEPYSEFQYWYGHV